VSRTAPEPFHAVILAGGRGRRLYPLTASVPKPLLRVGGHPVIELIIGHLVRCGAHRITVAVNYLADLVENLLGDGDRFGVRIDYVREVTPLGTAGPLGILAPWTGPLLVMNGDVISDIDMQHVLACHRERAAALTVTSMIQAMRLESGVLTTDASLRVTGIVEKPRLEPRISLGAYVLEPRVGHHIARNEPLEMPDLVQRLIALGEPVVAYDHKGVWLDIGRPDDLARAQADASLWEAMLAPRAPR
jgi:NDP-mannose synthase